MGTTPVTIKPAPLSLLVHAGLGSDAQHRLCDAAPDLLAALEFIENSMAERGYHINSACRYEARKAIALATGATP